MKKILRFEDFYNNVNEGEEGEEGLPYSDSVNKEENSDFTLGPPENDDDVLEKTVMLIHTIPGELEEEEVKYVELNYMSFFTSGYGSEGITEAVLDGDTIYVVDAASATGSGGFFTKPFSLEDLNPIKVFYNENGKVAVKEF